MKFGYFAPFPNNHAKTFSFLYNRQNIIVILKVQKAEKLPKEGLCFLVPVFIMKKVNREVSEMRILQFLNNKDFH